MSFYDYNNMKPSIPVQIQKTLGIVNKLKDEIEEKQMIIDSLEDSMVNMMNYFNGLFSEKMLHNAFYQQHKTKKSERPMYEFVKEVIVEKFFPNYNKKDVKIEHITCGGYEGYYYGFELNIKGCKLNIRIPAYEQISKKNMDEVHYGQIALYDTNKDHFLYFIKSSYYTNDIAKAAEEFMKEREKNNDHQEND